MQKFMINTTGLGKEQVTVINFVALVIFVGVQPLFGALSDRSVGVRCSSRSESGRPCSRSRCCRPWHMPDRRSRHSS